MVNAPEESGLHVRQVVKKTLTPQVVPWRWKETVNGKKTAFANPGERVYQRRPKPTNNVAREVAVRFRCDGVAPDEKAVLSVRP